MRLPSDRTARMRTVLGGDRLAKFVAGDRLNPFINNHLREVTSEPIKFRLGGNSAYGYEATVLADICDFGVACIKSKQATECKHDQLDVVR